LISKENFDRFSLPLFVVLVECLLSTDNFVLEIEPVSLFFFLAMIK